MIRRPILLGGLLLGVATWPVSDAAARNRDFEAGMGPAGSGAAAPEAQPTWAGQTFDAAGDAGNFVTDFGDPAAAAGQSLETSKGTQTRHTVRDQLIQNGQIQMDKHGVYRDVKTRKVVSGKTLDKTAGKLNQFDASMNRTKQSKGWQKAKGGLDKLGKFGEAGEWSQAGGTTAGELAGGDYVGAAKTGANHLLSNSAEAAGGVAGAKTGAALGGLVGGPPGAVVGGLVGGAGGAYAAGKAYDKYGKPVIEEGYDNLAGARYGDDRGKDPQGRADINAEKENWTPEMRERMKEMEQMRAALTPEAFEVWKKSWGRRAPEMVRPPSPEDLKDVDFQKAMTRIKVGIWESNRDHPHGSSPTEIDPDGKLAAAEKAVLDRIAQLEREVEWDVSKEEQARRAWAQQEELARLREEQQRIAEERDRRARDAAQAGQALDAFGAILGAMGQGMSQYPQGSGYPQGGENHPHPTSMPQKKTGKIPGHIHSDGSRD